MHAEKHLSAWFRSSTSEWCVALQGCSPAAVQVEKACEAPARRDQILQRVAFQYRKKRVEGLSQYRSQHAGVRDRTLRRAGVEALHQRHVLLRPTDDLSQIDLARRSREPEDRKSTRLNSSHQCASRMPSS